MVESSGSPLNCPMLIHRHRCCRAGRLHELTLEEACSARFDLFRVGNRVGSRASRSYLAVTNLAVAAVSAETGFFLEFGVWIDRLASGPRPGLQASSPRRWTMTSTSCRVHGTYNVSPW